MRSHPSLGCLSHLHPGRGSGYPALRGVTESPFGADSSCLACARGADSGSPAGCFRPCRSREGGRPADEQARDVPGRGLRRKSTATAIHAHEGRARRLSRRQDDHLLRAQRIRLRNGRQRNTASTSVEEEQRASPSARASVACSWRRTSCWSQGQEQGTALNIFLSNSISLKSLPPASTRWRSSSATRSARDRRPRRS